MTASTLKRHTHLRPGYDCLTTPCGQNGCGTRPGSNHGQHCDDWEYVVSDGEIALGLTAYSGKSPRGPARAPEGVTLSLHACFPSSREQAANEERAQECEWLDGGQCFSAGHWFGLASEFWTRAHTEDAFEQGEAFWLALEGLWSELSAKARGDRVEACACCKGTGLAVQP